MDRILGHKLITVPESVVDSLRLTQSEENTSDNPEVSEDVNEVDDRVLTDDSILDESVTPASIESEGDSTTRVKKSKEKALKRR